MKKWNAPTVEELNINETAHNWTGVYRDGGYIGDGEISGHLTWCKPDKPGHGGGCGGNTGEPTDDLS